MPAIDVTVIDANGNSTLLNGVQEETFVVESIIGRSIDTCDFTVHDKYSNIEIPSMADVVVTRSGDSGRLFAGLAAFITGTPSGFSRYWDVSCQDYTILLDRSLVLQNYPVGFTYGTNPELIGDKAIMASAFEEDLIGVSGASDLPSEIDAEEFVEQGLPVLAHQQFKYNSLREVVSQLAQYVGHEFYVDYDKKLHYYYNEHNPAPFSLTDGVPSNTALQYRNCQWKRDGTQLTNTFALFGDRLLSDSQVSLLSSDGSKTAFDLDFDAIELNFPILAEPGFSAIRVDKRGSSDRTLTADTHTGGDDVPVLTVAGAQFVSDGVVVGDIVLNTTDGSWGTITAVTELSIVAILRGGQDNAWDTGDVAVIPTWEAQKVNNDSLSSRGTFDVKHDVVGKTLVFDSPPPNNTYAIRLRYTYNFVGGQVDSDRDSYDRYGRVFARRVVVSDVNSAAGIIQKMENLKRQYANALEVVTVSIDDADFPVGNPDRFKAGQWVSFTNNILGVSAKDFLIHRITIRILGGGKIRYDLELRDWEVDLL